LLRAFDCHLSAQKLLYLDHLLACIDEVDRVLDDLPQPILRNTLSNQILNVLTGKPFNLKGFPETLEKRIIILKTIVEELGIEEKFAAAVSKIFKVTEAKRYEKNWTQFINFFIDEGRATAILPLSVMGSQATTSFIKFFESLCSIMGIADLLIDFNRDFKLNQIVIKPTLGRYFYLLRKLAYSGIRLVRLIPHKRRFIAYCWRMLKALMKKE